MIVQLDQLYVDAMKRRYIVGAFNVFNYDSLCAVLEAAEEEQSPVILQVSMGARKYVPDYRQFIEVMKIAALSVSIPVGINHDHCPTAEAAMQAVDAGVGGVMFDGSHLSFEENVRFTRKVVEYAHARGVCVEAELGRLPGFEDEIFADHVEFTNPDAAKRFVALTGCDSLAVSAGTSHGGVKAAENLPLHMEVLERIQAELPGFPLVLHGAASLPLHLIEYVNEQGGRVEVMKNCSESSIRRSAEYGVCKANMDVDNFLAFTGAVRRVLREQPDKYDPRVYLKKGKDAWKEEVMWKMSQVTGELRPQLGERGGESMIRAICLNPVIDRSYHVNGFEPGKKYFHLLREVSIGGKGINVAKVCKQCGEPVTLYGFIAGSNGRMIRAFMEKEGIDACLIEINGNTRETINIIDLEQGRESELVEQGPTVEKRQVEQLLCRLREDLQRDDIVICSGMTIEGAPDGLYSEISAMCRWKEARCFLDTNSVTVEQLRKDGYYFYKPNMQELFELFGMEPVSDRTAVRKLALQLVQDGVAYVLVSMGSEGGILAGREGCWEAVIPSVQVTSTIGSGDSTVAGFAIGLRKSWGMEEIFRFSMACGIANAMEKQVGRVNPERLEMIKNEIKINNIPNKEVSYL